MEQLTQAQHKAAEALYKQAGSAASEPAAGSGGSAGPGGSESAGGSAGDVIDAEVVEEDKK
jgi:molecular chaperone DnaK